MDKAWEQLQLAQRAFALGDLPGALLLAKQAKKVFDENGSRDLPEIELGDQQNRLSLRGRIHERLSRRKREDEEVPEPLDEAETFRKSVDRLIQAVGECLKEDADRQVVRSEDKALVLAHLRQDGTAEISAYLPSLDLADDEYFAKVYKRMSHSAKDNGVKIRFFLDEGSSDEQMGRLSFTLVGDVSLCRIFVTRHPRFQLYGEMVAPPRFAEDACKNYVAILDGWLNQ